MFNLSDIKRIYEPPHNEAKAVVLTSDCQYIEIEESYNLVLQWLKLMQTKFIYVPPLKDVNARIVDAMEDIART